MAQVVSEPITTGAGPEQGSAEVSGSVIGRSPWELFWRRFRKDRFAIAGLVIIVMMIILAITAPVFAKNINHHGPNDVNLKSLNEFGLPSGPS
ncbi:MAG: hypothetical protein ACT4PO_11950, partial [Actinomycetota bacterium]